MFSILWQIGYVVESMFEKLFRALWQKESVRHPHPALQALYLAWLGFSPSEVRGNWDFFFLRGCYLAVAFNIFDFGEIFFV